MSWLLCIKFPVSSCVVRTMRAEASSDYGKASVVLADPRLIRNPLISRSNSESLVQHERQQRKVAGAGLLCGLLCAGMAACQVQTC